MDSMIKWANDSSSPPEHTLNLLYSAQQHQPVPINQFPQPISALPRATPTASTPLSPSSAPTLGQVSLHSFWKLPTRAPTTHTQVAAEALATCEMDLCSAMPSSTNASRLCEDCDAPVASEPDAMDVDEGIEGSACCVTCVRLVCDTCSVNGNDGRRCLGCLSRANSEKRWVGGIGWI